MKIFRNIEEKLNFDPETRKSLINNILSHIAHFIYDDSLKNDSTPVLQKYCSDEDLLPLQTIQGAIVDRSKMNEMTSAYIDSNENLMKYLCYQALVCEKDKDSVTRLSEDARKLFCYFAAHLSMHIRDYCKSEGSVIAAAKILQAYFDQV